MKSKKLVFGMTAIASLSAVYLVIFIIGNPRLKAPPGDRLFPIAHRASLPSQSALERVRKGLNSDDAQTRDQTLVQDLPEFVRSDAPGAARFAQEISDVALRDRAMRVVAQTWGLQDAAKACDWAAALPDNNECQANLGAICIGLAVRNPPEAVRLAGKLRLSDGGVVQNLVFQWASKDITSALTWVEQQPAGKERDQLIGRVAFIQAQTNPSAAAHLVEQIPAGPLQTETTISIVNQWAQHDLTGALAWVTGFPPGITRQRAITELESLVALR